MNGRNAIIPGKYGGKPVALHLVDLTAIDIDAPHDRAAQSALLRLAWTQLSGVLTCAVCGEKIARLAEAETVAYMEPRRPEIRAVAICPDCAGHSHEDLEEIAPRILEAIGGD